MSANNWQFIADIPERQIYGSEAHGDLMTVRFVPLASMHLAASDAGYRYKVEQAFAENPDVAEYRKVLARSQDAGKEASRIGMSIRALEDQAAAVRRDLPTDAVAQLTSIETQLAPLKAQATNAKAIADELKNRCEPLHKRAWTAASRIAKIITLEMKEDMQKRRDAARAGICKKAAAELDALFLAESERNLFHDFPGLQEIAKGIMSQISQEATGVESAKKETVSA